MSVEILTRPAGPRDLKALMAMCDALNAQSNVPTGRLDPKGFRAALFGKRAFVFGDIAEAADTDEPGSRLAPAAAGRSPRRPPAREIGYGRRRPVGYALSHDAFTTDYGERGMYLVDVYVEPAWRRTGIGKALMAAVAARAQARGGTHVWWASMPFNYRARRFYARLGATDETLHSHAVFGKAFDRLAAYKE